MTEAQEPLRNSRGMLIVDHDGWPSITDVSILLGMGEGGRYEAYQLLDKYAPSLQRVEYTDAADPVNPWDLGAPKAEVEVALQKGKEEKERKLQARQAYKQRQEARRATLPDRLKRLADAEAILAEAGKKRLALKNSINPRVREERGELQSECNETTEKVSSDSAAELEAVRGQITERMTSLDKFLGLETSRIEDARKNRIQQARDHLQSTLAAREVEIRAEVHAEVAKLNKIMSDARAVLATGGTV